MTIINICNVKLSIPTKNFAKSTEFITYKGKLINNYTSYWSEVTTEMLSYIKLLPIIVNTITV